YAVLDAPRAKACEVHALLHGDGSILMPGYRPVRRRRLVEKQNAYRAGGATCSLRRKRPQWAVLGNQFDDVVSRIESACSGTIRSYRLEMGPQPADCLARENVLADPEPIALQRRGIHHIALTIDSVIFLASPNNIMVLSR